jgi:GT2 family glycosyltransferase
VTSKSDEPFVVPPPPAKLVELTEPPSFSVIVAAHQAAATVAEAVESALDQDPPPLEVVVCDDGSTDDTEGALRPFADRVHLIHQQRGGESAAKNVAARAARGDFVVILDADDIYLPGRLGALGRLAQARPDLDILTTDAYLAVGQERIATCYDDGHRFEQADQRRGILERNFVFGLAAVRRESFLASGGFSEEVATSADWDCWIRMILAGSRAGLVAAPLAVYRLHQASINADRLAMYRGRASTLTRVQQRTDLSEAERAVVVERIQREDRRIALESLLQALEAPDRATRRLARQVARRSDLPPSTRLKAIAALIAPRMVGRIVRRRRSAYWIAVGDRRLPRR